MPRVGWRVTAVRLQGGLSSFWRKYRVPLVSCLAFLALVGILIVLYSRFVGTALFDGFLRFYARATGAVLDLTGAGVSVPETVVSSKRFAFSCPVTASVLCTPGAPHAYRDGQGPARAIVQALSKHWRLQLVARGRRAAQPSEIGGAAKR